MLAWFKFKLVCVCVKHHSFHMVILNRRVLFFSYENNAEWALAAAASVV